MACGSTGSRVSCGRDLNCVPEVADTLAAVAKLGFDFLCMPLFHSRFKREFELEPAKTRSGAHTRSDLLLCGRDWNTLIVGKLSQWIDPDAEVEAERRNSEAALTQELNFSAYLGLPVFMLHLKGPHCANLARLLLNHIHTGHHTSNFWIRVPLMAPEDTREDVIENEPGPCVDDTSVTRRPGAAIEVGADMPSDAVIDKWLGEPIKAAILPTSIFLTNKKGFPVLSKAHQRIIFSLFKLEAQFVFTGTSRHTEKDFRSYLQYLEYLNQNRPAPNSYELFAKGYEDYLQSPSSHSWTTWSLRHMRCLRRILLNTLSTNRLYISVCLTEFQRSRKTQMVLMVLGAGRGPLVNASLRAARQADRKLKIYAVEKNPNAVITLENWRFEEWGDQVTVVSCDMREWSAPEKADIIVSELLGSFGDNELSPDTGCRERDKDPECHFETPYVVRLHNFHQLAEPKPCFTFRHPTKGINPQTHSAGMFSWFPIFFPLKVLPTEEGDRMTEGPRKRGSSGGEDSHSEPADTQPGAAKNAEGFEVALKKEIGL
ncbi:hypothetical protein F7725_011819, partial [Dissostichus mawsoni]